MPSQPNRRPDQAALSEAPDRTCAWCKVPMLKRLVGGNRFIHYTCPTCVFQHTTKRENEK